MWAATSNLLQANFIPKLSLLSPLLLLLFLNHSPLSPLENNRFQGGGRQRTVCGGGGREREDAVHPDGAETPAQHGKLQGLIIIIFLNCKMMIIITPIS